MCGCDHHRDANEPCTCECPEHRGVREQMAREEQCAREQAARDADEEVRRAGRALIALRVRGVQARIATGSAATESRAWDRLVLALDKAEDAALAAYPPEDDG